MKQYPPRKIEIIVCECGHTEFFHGLFYETTGHTQCRICMCPKYVFGEKQLV